jgi:uncharacterized RDD family membrane protein YckC
LARRVAARAIDAATVFFLLWALVVVRVLWFMDFLSDRVDPEPWGRAFVATATFVVFSAVYEVIFLVHNKGQTPGKDIMKVRVVPTDGNKHVGAGRAVARWLLPGLAVLVPPFWLGALAATATGIPALAQRRRRAVHDLVGGTVVVPYDRDEEDPASRVTTRPRRRRLWALGPDPGEEGER